MFAKFGEIKKAIDVAKQVILRHDLIYALPAGVFQQNRPVVAPERWRRASNYSAKVKIWRSRIGRRASFDNGTLSWLIARPSIAMS